MIHLVTFSDDKMTLSRELCAESAKSNGVDFVIQNSFISIDPLFMMMNRDIFSHERGCGHWLWKSFIVYREIMNMKEGDILIYSDAGIKWISNVNEIISRMDQDIFLFSNGHFHIHWCKMDVIHAINCEDFYSGWVEGGTTMDNERNIQYEKYQQVQASVIFFKVNQNTRNFIKEWLLWCQMPGFIDDSPSKLPNHPEFAEHRHDQAILTCLAIKYGYKLHWWADKLWYESQRYRWAEDTYPSMFEHHRKRDPGKGDGINPEW